MELKIHPLYQSAVKKTLSDLKHQIDIKNDEVEKVWSSKHEAITLSFGITDGRVLTATHQNATGATAAVLETLCRFAINKPIREVSDHGIITVEFEMRDPSSTHEVKGLLSPENADPVFSIPTRLVRTLYQKYSKENPLTDGEYNFWQSRPDESWLKISEVQRFKRLQGALYEIVEALGFSQSGVELVEIQNYSRAVISLANSIDKLKFGNLMIRMENTLKSKVGTQIELTLESLEDKNKRIGRTTIDRKEQKPLPEGVQI